MMTMAQSSADDVVPAAYTELESFKFLQTVFPILFTSNEDGTVSLAGQGKNLLCAIDPSINNTIEDLYGWVTSPDFDGADVKLSAALKAKLRRVVREHVEHVQAPTPASSVGVHAPAPGLEQLPSGGPEEYDDASPAALAQIQLPQSKIGIKMRRASVVSVGSNASVYSAGGVAPPPPTTATTPAAAVQKRKNSFATAASAPVSTTATPVPDALLHQHAMQMQAAGGPHALYAAASAAPGTSGMVAAAPGGALYPTSMSMPHLPSLMPGSSPAGYPGVAVAQGPRSAELLPTTTALPVSKKRKGSSAGGLGNSNLANNFYTNRANNDLAVEYQEITFLYKDVEWEIKWTETHGNIHVSKTGGWMKVIVSAINRRFNFFMSHKTHKQLVLPVDNTLLTYVHVAMHFISTLPPYPFENKNCLVNYVELNKQNILNNVAECAALCHGVGKCALCDTIHEGDPKAYEYWRNYAIVNVPGESGRGMLCSVQELRAGGPFVKPQPGAVTVTLPPHVSTPAVAVPVIGAPVVVRRGSVADEPIFAATASAPRLDGPGLPSRPASSAAAAAASGMMRMLSSSPHTAHDDAAAAVAALASSSPAVDTAPVAALESRGRGTPASSPTALDIPPPPQRASSSASAAAVLAAAAEEVRSQDAGKLEASLAPPDLADAAGVAAPQPVLL